MQYITTTELRTMSKKLIETLREGHSVDLVHRSKVVGEIKPKDEAKPLTRTDIVELKKLVKELNLPKTSYKQRERIYRKHLMKKYGQSPS